MAIDEKKLIEWLLSKKYIAIDENSAEMTKEFEKNHQWELSRNCFINNIIKFIETQPKVNEWIPVSEKLPEVEKEVLVCTYGYSQRVWCLLDNDEEYVWEDEFGGWNEFEDVIAWMPLPKRYKPE